MKKEVFLRTKIEREKKTARSLNFLHEFLKVFLNAYLGIFIFQTFVLLSCITCLSSSVSPCSSSSSVSSFPASSSFLKTNNSFTFLNLKDASSCFKTPFACDSEISKRQIKSKTSFSVYHSVCHSTRQKRNAKNLDADVFKPPSFRSLKNLFGFVDISFSVHNKFGLNFSFISSFISSKRKNNKSSFFRNRSVSCCFCTDILAASYFRTSKKKQETHLNKKLQKSNLKEKQVFSFILASQHKSLKNFRLQQPTTLQALRKKDALYNEKTFSKLQALQYYMSHYYLKLNPYFFKFLSKLLIRKKLLFLISLISYFSYVSFSLFQSYLKHRNKLVSEFISKCLACIGNKNKLTDAFDFYSKKIWFFDSFKKHIIIKILEEMYDVHSIRNVINLKFLCKEMFFMNDEELYSIFKPHLNNLKDSTFIEYFYIVADALIHSKNLKKKLFPTRYVALHSNYDNAFKAIHKTKEIMLKKEMQNYIRAEFKNDNFLQDHKKLLTMLEKNNMSEFFFTLNISQEDAKNICKSVITQKLEEYTAKRLDKTKDKPFKESSLEEKLIVILQTLKAVGEDEFDFKKLLETDQPFIPSSNAYAKQLYEAFSFESDPIDGNVINFGNKFSAWNKEEKDQYKDSIKSTLKQYGDRLKKLKERAEKKNKEFDIACEISSDFINELNKKKESFFIRLLQEMEYVKWLKKHREIAEEEKKKACKNEEKDESFSKGEGEEESEDNKNKSKCSIDENTFVSDMIHKQLSEGKGVCYTIDYKELSKRALKNKRKASSFIGDKTEKFKTEQKKNDKSSESHRVSEEEENDLLDLQKETVYNDLIALQNKETYYEINSENEEGQYECKKCGFFFFITSSEELTEAQKFFSEDFVCPRCKCEKKNFIKVSLTA